MEKISRVEAFPNLVASKEPATVYDVACKSIPELVYLIMQRLNETIEHMNKNDATLQQQLDYVLAQLEDFYLKFDEDLRQEIQIVLQAWIEDGTLEQVISQLVENRAVYPSVAALQQAPNIFQLGAIVELQGYHYAGDGAGHKRIIEDVDDGSGVAVGNKFANIIEKNEVFVEWFGAKGEETFDNSESFKKAFATSKNIKVGAGTYYLTETIELDNYQSFKGCGSGKTKIIHESTKPFLKQKVGVVQFVEISGMTIYSAAENTKVFDFTAFYDKNHTSTGGFWYSKIADIELRVNGNSSTGFYFEATDTTQGDLANQFIIFENVRVFRKHESTTCLHLKEQVGQFNFISSSFDSTVQDTANSNVKITGRVGGGTIFTGCTFQNAKSAVGFEGSLNSDIVSFVACWFENITATVFVGNYHRVRALNCHFANCLQISGGNFSDTNISNSLVIGNTASIGSFGQSAKITTSNNIYQTSSKTGPDITKPMLEVGNTADGILQIDQQTVRLNGNGAVSTIQSLKIGEGETIRIFINGFWTVFGSRFVRGDVVEILKTGTSFTIVNTEKKLSFTNEELSAFDLTKIEVGRLFYNSGNLDHQYSTGSAWKRLATK